MGIGLASHLLQLFPPNPGAVIGGFWPLPGEIDLRGLLHTLHERGHLIALPETPSRGNPLIFRHWHPESTMIAERFGTLRPDGPILGPTYLLVPLLGFDAMGHRLGYGGGYYDRTLAQTPQAIAVGCGFAAQQLDVVPVNEYDARLDAVATEAGVLVFERRS